MKPLLLVASSLLLLGCGEKTYTENDFILNDALRTEFATKCQGSSSTNCSSVRSAIDAVQKAQRGDVDEQLHLADAYISARNFKQAVGWLSRAAERGSDEAVEKLGQIGYLIGSEKNPSRADAAILAEVEAIVDAYRKTGPVLRTYLRRVAQGDNETLISIGVMYRKGEGVEQDFGKARSYFDRYAQARDVKSPGRGEYYLARMHLEGEGLEKSAMAAAESFDKSCQLGFKESCYELGDLYFRGGEGIEPNYQKASELLDVYAAGEPVDSRAVRYAQEVFEMYSKGGFGIDRNPSRTNQLKALLCPSYGDMLDACQS